MKKQLLTIRSKVEFLQWNGRNERKRGSIAECTQPPRSGTAAFGCGFPLGARFGNYGMHKLDIRPIKILLAFFAALIVLPYILENAKSVVK